MKDQKQQRQQQQQRQQSPTLGELLYSSTRPLPKRIREELENEFEETNDENDLSNLEGLEYLNS